jgi:outer membrane immunogenic protein
MRNFVWSGAAFMALVAWSPANAADVMAKPQPPAAYDWSGVYVGGQLGGGWQSTAFQDPSATQVVTNCCDLIGSLAAGDAASNATGSGFLGGAQAGWTYQIGRLVIGGDFDFTGSNLKANSTGIIPGAASAAANVTEKFSVRTEWTATATTTIGLARDRWMLYSKVGTAWAHDSYSLNVGGVNQGFGPAGSFSFASNASDTRIGWTAGLGIEMAFTDAWSAKLEYDYLNFGTKSVDFNGVIQNPGGGAPITNPSTFNTNNMQQISEIKVGVNYKFAPGLLF